MSTRQARLTKQPRRNSVSEATGAERRKSPRHSARNAATLLSSQGESAKAMLVDVSTHGCCVKCAAEWVRTGAFVAIGIDDYPRLQAIVRWVRDDSAGMEFLRPIPAERREWHALMDLPFGP